MHGIHGLTGYKSSRLASRQTVTMYTGVPTPEPMFSSDAADAVKPGYG